MYPGPCGCPNNCYADLSRGICDTTNQQQLKCKCWPGWGGADCSIPVCPNNTCHGNGVCKEDYCECDASFTGANCLPVFSVPQVPFGPFFPDYYVDDPYGDEHPIFNLSSVAVLRVEIPESDLVTLLTPTNFNNRTWVTGANITLITGDIYSVIEPNSGVVRVGGGYSKRQPKKGFLMKSDKLISDQTFGPHHAKIKKLKTKTGVNDLSYINSIVFTDCLRALASPAPRVSISQFWMNSVLEGVVLLYEAVDKQFLASRFGHKKGNLYKGASDLAYRGDSPTAYDGNGYEQSEGNGDWTDFISFVKLIADNSTTAKQLEEMLDVDLFLRMQAVEAIFSDGDGFTCSGKNYYLYNNNTHHDSATKPKFVFFRHDFDDAFGLKSSNTPCDTKASFWATLNLLEWGQAATCGKGKASPLTSKVLSFPEFRQRFVDYLHLILDKIITKHIEEGPMFRRVSEFFRIYPQYLVDDRSYTLNSAGCGGFDFYPSLLKSQFIPYLTQRYVSAKKQLPPSKLRL